MDKRFMGNGELTQVDGHWVTAIPEPYPSTATERFKHFFGLCDQCWICSSATIRAWHKDQQDEDLARARTVRERAMKFQVTKKQCRQKIDEWGNVCDSCGRDLEPIRTVDNFDNPTYWPGCWHGGKDGGSYTNGVKKEIYELAVKLICNGERGYYHLSKSEYWKTPEQREYWFRSQVSGMCSNLRRIENLRTNPARMTKDEFLAEQY